MDERITDLFERVNELKNELSGILEELNDISAEMTEILDEYDSEEAMNELDDLDVSL